MKKILSLILALLMTASTASMIGAAEEAAIADDAAVETTAAPAAEASPYADAIAFLHSYGIYKGKSADDLAAADPIERYQMALFVARISTGWVDDAQWASSTWVADQWYDRDHDTSGFDDLEGTPAVNYLGALSYASQKGIIEGYGNKKFGPTDGITYQNALTMIVRTLGYTNLAWPWGYIEKAVTLGLTVGIPSSVKYTDELNRGEVAQLIYNALFIPTKEGDTLAARNFNGELGWETIIITVAGRGRYIPDPTKTGKDLASDAGKDIGFNVVKEDGTLDPTTYFVKNDDPVSFNFPEHEERFLGYAYKALFNKDENSNYVTLISVKSLKHDEVWNYGLPTKGDDGKYPITSYLEGKKLVSKFSKNTYLNTVGVELNGEWSIDNARKYEFILKNALEGSTVVVDAGRKYAIDWTTGNILQFNADGKGAIKTSGVTYTENGVEYKDLTYDVAWYYNELLGQYFRFKTVQKDKEVEYVGIDILDPSDVQALIENSRLTANKDSWTGLSDTGIKNTAYASLISFDLPGYEPNRPNYGLYEEYRFGQYKEYDAVPTVGGDKTACYVLESRDAVAEPMYKEVTKKDDFKSGTVAIAKSIGWISEDSIDTPTVGDYVIYSADLGTGEIKIVKIIYDASNEKADKDNFVATGIVRAYNTTEGVTTVTIGENKYSYEYNDLLGNPFGYTVSTDKTWGPLYRAAFSRYFKALFNQFVKYVVVDGKLVWIELSGKQDNVIVVDSYAGLSSDGYIVVNGYKTDDLKLTQLKIGSYNGWIKGDYYYYLTDEKVEDSFTRGSLYRITSTGKDAYGNDVYYVYTIGKDFVSVETAPETDENGYLVHYHDKDGNIYTLTETLYDNLVYSEEDLTRLNNVYGFSGEWTKVVVNSGYRSINGGAYEKATSKDKYILVCNPIDNANKNANGYRTAYDGAGHDYAPIIVYNGSGRDGWSVEGYRIKGVGDNTFLLVGVDLNKIIGFNVDQYRLSYVLFLHYDYTKAAYDSADADGWYLLGASNYEATVFNWYNGKIETKTAVNKDLKIGYSYTSIDGVIVNDAPYAAYELDIDVPGAYLYEEQYGSILHYGFGSWLGYLTAAVKSDDGDTWKAAVELLTKPENFSKYILSVDRGLTKKGVVAKDLVKSLNIFLVDPDRYVDLDDDGIAEAPLTIGEITAVDRDALHKWIVDNDIDLAKLYFWYIVDAEGNVVVYINYDSVAVKTVPAKAAEKLAEAEAIVISSGAEQFRATNFNWFGNRADTKADTDTAAIKAELWGFTDDDDDPIDITKVVLSWGSDLAAGTINLDKLSHHEVDVKDFHFGRKGYCEKENFYIRITDEDGTVRAYDYEDESTNCIITKMYDAQLHDETECDLIQALEIPVGPIDLNYPDLEDYLGEIEFEEITEDLIRFYCAGGCKCIIEGESDIYDILADGYKTDEYTMSKAVAERLAAAINASSVPEETTFIVEFRDSSDTEYLFRLTFYVKALFKAVVDKYGHWTVEFDKYLTGADITGSSIKGQNYKFDSTQPEYKDRYVGQADRTQSNVPTFDLQTLTYKY